jgi:large subunit ribosomal protein L22
MISTAKLKYLRIAPRKVRLIADLIRGERADNAQNILNFSYKKGILPILKLLNQAIVNAKNSNPKIDEKSLYISKISVDEGPRLKRTLPRSRGRADIIHKKTSHIIIILDLAGESEKAKFSKGAKGKKGKEDLKKKEIKEDIKESGAEKEEVLEEKKTDEGREKPKWAREKKKFIPKGGRKGLNKIFRRKAI